MPGVAYDIVRVSLATATPQPGNWVEAVKRGQPISSVTVIGLPGGASVNLHLGTAPGIPALVQGVQFKMPMRRDAAGNCIFPDTGLYVEVVSTAAGELVLLVTFGVDGLIEVTGGGVPPTIPRVEDLFNLGERIWQIAMGEAGGGANFHYVGISIPTNGKKLAIVEGIWVDNAIAHHIGMRSPAGVGQQTLFSTPSSISRDGRSVAMGDAPTAVLAGGWNLTARFAVLVASGTEGQHRGGSTDFAGHTGRLGGPWVVSPGTELIVEAEATNTAIRAVVVWREKPIA